MARVVGIGHQNFEQLIQANCFYIDKTGFIKEWWENKDDVTLITRPRRFGKTLNMSMLEQFFSVECQDKSCLFEGLSIWEDKRYRRLQGTYPVIFLSFAEVKENKYPNVRRRINHLITGLYSRFYYLLDSDALTMTDKIFFRSIHADMEEAEAVMAVQKLSEFLFRHYGKFFLYFHFPFGRVEQDVGISLVLVPIFLYILGQRLIRNQKIIMYM